LSKINEILEEQTIFETQNSFQEFVLTLALFTFGILWTLIGKYI